MSCRNPIFEAVADLDGEQKIEAEASWRLSRISSTSLGVVTGDLSEAAFVAAERDAALEIEACQAACDAAGGAP